MTGEEFKRALKQLGWKQTDLAKRMGLHKMTVYQWTKEGIPQWASEYIRAMLALKALHSEFLSVPKDDEAK